MTGDPPTSDHSRSSGRVIAAHEGLELRADEHDRPFIEAPDRVLVLPLNYAGEILFLHEGSLPAGAPLLTVPGGSIADGEAGEAAARRVLEAETGFQAEVWFSLGAGRPLAREVRWPVHFFVGRNLVPARAMSDPVFQRPVTRVALDGFEALFTAGQVRDVVLIALLYMAQRFTAGHLRFDESSH